MKKLLPYIVILSSIVLSVLSWFYYPDRYATHWGAFGEADGYSSKGINLFVISIIMAVVFALLKIVPKMDPEKKNIDKFLPTYDLFVNGFLVFFLYLQSLMFVYNVIAPFNFVYGIIPGLAVMFYGLGTLLESAKRNYSIGIRTPWTLASDEVWDKTHKLGAKMFRYTAVASLIGVLFPKLAIFIFLFCILGTTLFLVIYSYFEFKKA